MPRWRPRKYGLVNTRVDMFAASIMKIISNGALPYLTLTFKKIKSGGSSLMRVLITQNNKFTA